jgi:hypothetical protein
MRVRRRKPASSGRDDAAPATTSGQAAGGAAGGEAAPTDYAEMYRQAAIRERQAEQSNIVRRLIGCAGGQDGRAAACCRVLCPTTTTSCRSRSRRCVPCFSALILPIESAPPHFIPAPPSPLPAPRCAGAHGCSTTSRR